MEVEVIPQNVPFTDFGSINKKSDLTNLNLDWSEKDLPQGKRTKHVHSLHPYLGKFVPQLPEMFLRKYKPKRVLDPFSGSGTTLVESSILGIDCVGVDLSPFNCLIDRVKTSTYSIVELEHEVKKMLSYLKMLEKWRSGDREIDYENIFDIKIPDNQYMKTWFSDESLQGIYFFLYLIERFQYQDFFKLVLSRGTRSSRKVPHYDLDFCKEPVNEPYYCFKHSRTCYPTKDSVSFLKRYLLDSFKRVKEYSSLRHRSSSIDIINGDSTKVDFGFFDFVFTSPPYVGLIDYHEQHRYSFELFDLPMNKEREIGSPIFKSSKKSVELYKTKMLEVYENIKKQIEKGGIVVTVVNDKHNLYDPKDFGFKELYRIERNVNRRTGRRNSDFYESLLIWKHT